MSVLKGALHSMAPSPHAFRISLRIVSTVTSFVTQDMNDPAAFGTNEERPFNWPEDELPYWSLKCPVTKYDDPPYKPGEGSISILEENI